MFSSDHLSACIWLWQVLRSQNTSCTFTCTMVEVICGSILRCVSLYLPVMYLTYSLSYGKLCTPQHSEVSGLLILTIVVLKNRSMHMLAVWTTWHSLIPTSNYALSPVEMTKQSRWHFTCEEQFECVTRSNNFLGYLIIMTCVFISSAVPVQTTGRFVFLTTLW